MRKNQLPDKKLISKWIRALKSGKFKQTTNTLEAEGKYCCLGLLCEVAKLEHLKRGGFLIPKKFRTNKHSVRKHTLENKDFGLQLKDINQLIEMNDTYRNRFTTIANWIKANIKTA